VKAPPHPSATVPKSPAAHPRARSLRMPAWP
jgi:hypothetical protein